MTEAHPISQALESRLLGVEEAALFLGVTARSLYRLVDKGMLRPVRLPGFRRTFFDRRDLEALVQSAKDRSSRRIVGRQSLRQSSNDGSERAGRKGVLARMARRILEDPAG